MATKPKQPEPLTDTEKRFIINTLAQLELKGTPEALTQAIEVINSITTKLIEELEQTQ